MGERSQHAYNQFNVSSPSSWPLPISSLPFSLGNIFIQQPSYYNDLDETVPTILQVPSLLSRLGESKLDFSLKTWENVCFPFLFQTHLEVWHRGRVQSPSQIPSPVGKRGEKGEGRGGGRKRTRLPDFLSPVLDYMPLPFLNKTEI